ncbi:FusB/FusC family EF-G-binding protein [Metabacillus halosaccharovorans]|uniref:FusB/FusC family EF-G-binding protein n=1 Tax=Metabacillus halosaccharovorans TaxID=930124 RepID=A0ABT3DLU2_9BACI|nr:FusB/FusC family EF-G-binding protein [Metabacillus halosaccharovorans]MCV9887836.1 FusB/FusC family EF-G-binding protein [Metabacillus halosaccharovorans]
MKEEFIKNEQLNFIKKQIALIKDISKRNVPKSVLLAEIDLANAKIMDNMPHATEEQLEMLDISTLRTDVEYEQYIQHLSSYVLPFPKITEQHLKKMFPKNKKLKLPDLSIIDRSKLTYLSWTDLGLNKKFIVYELDGKMVGIECKVTPTSKANYCSICQSIGEVTYFSTKTKAKKSKNPDYYKSIGNLICTDSNECNKKITNVEYLTTVLREALAK